MFVDLFARPLVKKEKIKTVCLPGAALQPA
jgi:hypothetical protein